MKLHDTREWEPERVMSYGPQITAAMKKLVERFPRETTVKGLAEDVITGRQQMWLVLKGEEFRSMVLTEIKDNPKTDIRTVFVTSMAGDEGVDAVPLISGIEGWARSEGAHQMMIVGRWGWKRSLASEGYEMDAVVFRKGLE